MRKNNLKLTERAVQLYREMARSIDQRPLALHINWDVTAGDACGFWRVGLSPEAHFEGFDKQLLDMIVAGMESWSSLTDQPGNRHPS
jgi:hypothetical protein